MASSLQNSKSRYTQGGTTDRTADVKMLGWWERTALPADPLTDTEYTIPPGFDRRPDLIASYWLGQPRHTWVLLMYNNTVDINEEFRSGQIITLPNPERVATLL